MENEARRRRMLLGLFAVVLMGSLSPFLVEGVGPGTAAPGRATHLNRAIVPGGCAACHRGHGNRATTMLRGSKEDLCFRCHGPYRAGQKGVGRYDLYGEFLKPSRHPVLDTAKYHVEGEELPERNPNTPRHVACDDCHSIHEAVQGAAMAGVQGYSAAGGRKKRAEKDYDVCYRCHADSANLGFDGRNVMDEFSTLNPSFHPVGTVGRSGNLPSLNRSSGARDSMECLDCHGNDDSSGPQGPHGSMYAPLLKKRYQIEDGPEGPGAYELCYECHDRRSILADESFRRHNRHIVLEGTSCHTCHASHGSRANRDLIYFEPVLVTSSQSSGGPLYQDSPIGIPLCYLTCHGVDHGLEGVGGRPWPSPW